MYICFFCKKSSKPGDKLKLIVTKTRTVTTPEGREGTQIVEERAQCPDCAGTRVTRPAGTEEVAVSPAVGAAA